MSAMITDRLKAWAYLSRVVEGPSAHLQALLKQGRDPEAIAHAVKHREPWIGDLLRETLSRYEWDVAQQDLEQILALGGRLITPEDREWPATELDHAFGFAASGMSDHVRTYQDDAVPPHALWVRGGDLRSLTAQAVALVGTRAVSQYGREVTAMIVDNLVPHQWTIISGGALGVDTVAHTTALRAGGSTVVVAACGLDRSYPAHNRALFEEIVSRSGAIVTEYPPGTPPQRHRFLTRNRLVAGLTGATVLVEAGWRSGARNTAAWARHMNRPVGAVPGPATSASSTGCHDAIREGEAVLVTSPEHVLALYRGIGDVDEDGQLELDWAKNPIQSLSRNELRVYDAVPPAGAPGGADTAAIAAEAALTLPLTMHLLLALEKKGVVTRTGSTWARTA